MKKLPLFLSTLFVALFLTACNTANDPQEMLSSPKVDQGSLLHALFAPEVAANSGKKVNGVLQMKVDASALEEDLQQAIKNGALEEVDQITITAEQAELIFGTTDLSAVPDTKNALAEDRVYVEFCRYVEICIQNTGDCYFVEHCVLFWI